jgi:hypothetical protein
MDLSPDTCASSKMGYIRWHRSPEIGTSSIDWAKLSRFYLNTETESSPKRCVLKNKQDGFR